MDISSVGSDFLNSTAAGITSDKVKADSLQAKLKNKPATDEELMGVCKSFESYMLEQVMKEMENSVNKEEENSPYLDQFGDMLYEEYAKKATDNGGLGLAQMLYDAMKRNS